LVFDLTGATELYRMSPTSDPSKTPPVSAKGLPEPALAGEAIALLLRPLSRLMIDHGVQLASMVELLKKALVDEALASYGVAEKSATDTRVALQTGVHRKDVKRLREAPRTPGIAAPMVPLAASVVGRWISEPRFLNADQSPRMLARTPKLGNRGEPDFTDLVNEVSRDVGARAVLDELLRLGVVAVDPEGMVALSEGAFVPQKGLKESFHFLAANVSDHLSTAVHNLAPGREGPAMLEQSAFSMDLSDEQAQELGQLARRLWSKSLRQFMQTASVAELRSQSSDGVRYRVRYGVYFHQAEQEAVEAPVPPGPAPRRHKRRP
jgi:hypothetical protein